jgi:hypothetical protein
MLARGLIWDCNETASRHPHPCRLPLRRIFDPEVEDFNQEYCYAICYRRHDVVLCHECQR